MSEYKKGQLIKHKPSGCVGQFNKYCDDSIRVHFPYGEMKGLKYSFWLIEDCEPVTDNQPVDSGLYEAVESALKDSRLYFTDSNGDVYCQVCNETGGHSRTCPIGFIFYALANSTPVEPQGWITSRRPTEDDAWGVKGSLLKCVTYWMDEIGPCFGEWESVKNGGQPWQPFPASMRVKPVQPKCETCQEHIRVGDRGIHVCCAVKSTAFKHGMEGCVYKAKGE